MKRRASKLKTGRVLLAAVLLFSAALSPTLFSWYSGGWEHPTESVYRIRTGGRGDEVSHQRWLYEAGRNLRQGRVVTLTAIDEKQPINSTPEFQYYSVGIYALLAPLVNATGDVMLTYLIALYFFSALLTLGVFLWTRRQCGCSVGGVVLTAIVVTSPFLRSQSFDLFVFTGLGAIALFPLASYLWLRYLLHEPAGTRGVAMDASLFLGSTLLGALFLLSHNLTVMLFATFLSIPLLLQIRRETRGRRIAWTRASAVPVAVLGLTLFYWMPILRDHGHLLIDTSGDGVLRTMFDRLPLPQLVFSPVAASASTVALYPQVGWAVLAAGLLLFSARHWYLYLIEGLLLLLSTTDVWSWVPAYLHAVQFPFRCLICVPMLLIFQARRLRGWQITSLAALGVLSALVNFPDPQWRKVTADHSVHPPFFYSQFYRQGSDTRALPPAVALPAGKASLEVSRMLSARAVRLATRPIGEGEKALTYRITLPQGRPLPHHVRGALVLDYPDGETRQAGITEFPSETPGYVSGCLPGASRAHLYLVAGDSAHYPLDAIRIEEIGDTTHRYLTAPDGLHPVLCDYHWEPSSQSWIFHAAPEELGRPVLLPLYFSPDNRLSTSRFAAAAESGYLYWTTLEHRRPDVENSPVESFSVFRLPASGGTEFHLRPTAGNRYRCLPPLVLLAALLWFLVRGITEAAAGRGVKLSSRSGSGVLLQTAVGPSDNVPLPSD